MFSLNPKVLGRGSYGVVRAGVRQTDDKVFAVKQVKKQRLKSPIWVADEVEMLTELNHDNIIKLHEVYESPSASYIVTELCIGGEVYQRISSRGRVPEKEAALLLKQMLSALSYLHSKGITHRDMKPENFLFTSSAQLQIKLIDFGYAKRFDGRLLTEKIGTAYYVAPEVLKGKYSASCDLWSVGAIAYAMLVGYPPYDGANDYDITNKNLREEEIKYNGKEWKLISATAIDFVKRLLCRNPFTRMTVQEAMLHPWVTGSDKPQPHYLAAKEQATLNRIRYVLDAAFITQNGLQAYLNEKGLTEETMPADVNLYMEYCSNSTIESCAKRCNQLALTLPGRRAYNQQVLRFFEAIEGLDSSYFNKLTQALERSTPDSVASALQKFLDA